MPKKEFLGILIMTQKRRKNAEMQKAREDKLIIWNVNLIFLLVIPTCKDDVLIILNHHFYPLPYVWLKNAYKFGGNQLEYIYYLADTNVDHPQNKFFKNFKNQHEDSSAISHNHENKQRPIEIWFRMCQYVIIFFIGFLISYK